MSYALPKFGLGHLFAQLGKLARTKLPPPLKTGLENFLNHQ